MLDISQLGLQKVSQWSVEEPRKRGDNTTSAESGSSGRSASVSTPRQEDGVGDQEKQAAVNRLLKLESLLSFVVVFVLLEGNLLEGLVFAP